MSITTPSANLLFGGADWDFATLDRTYDAVAAIGVGEMGLDIYPNQIEVISSDQMLDAYASIGLPLMYNHWSFGKQVARQETLYRKGYQGLAYELVINSSPCISYVMEENSIAMQTLVMAHAAIGHNHFFKNNGTFQEWTDAEGILEYLAFAKRYIARCEERHGLERVERVLDAAHALMSCGVFRYRRARTKTLENWRERLRARRAHAEVAEDELWRVVPGGTEAHDTALAADADAPEDDSPVGAPLQLPEENILYFLEKNSPVLQGWEREILRIVRAVAQYLYPQRQTKMMNEGCATWVHHHICHRLHETGRISDGALLEILHSHAAVVRQPDFDSQGYGGINPYWLGFNMCRDISRICTQPTEEDRAWFPEIAGKAQPLEVLTDAWASFRDESMIRQYLSPRLIREMRLFSVFDDAADQEAMTVGPIHDERGYARLRHLLAGRYEASRLDPDIQVVAVDLHGDRTLHLRHTMHDGVALEPVSRAAVLRHLRTLWGHDVHMESIEPAAS